jgi:hypothetical protein
MSRTGGLKPPLRIMAASNRHSTEPEFQANSPGKNPPCFSGAADESE